MERVRIGNLEVSRLILGGNPFSGFSHWHAAGDAEMKHYYTAARIKEVYHQLLEADLCIKTGRYEGELALNILIAELCRRHKA